MRRRKAPKRNRIGPIPEGCDLEETAKKVRYVGSPEHKDVPSFAGHPRPRADATICDRSFIDRLPEIQDWLEKAIRAGNVGDFLGERLPSLRLA